MGWSRCQSERFVSGRDLVFMLVECHHRPPPHSADISRTRARLPQAILMARVAELERMVGPAAELHEGPSSISAVTGGGGDDGGGGGGGGRAAR